MEQREALLDCLSHCDDDDLVLLSDLDEIPRAEVMLRLKESGEAPVHLPLPMHLYWLNWRWWPMVSRGFSISRVFPLGMARASSMDAMRLTDDWPFPSFTSEFPDGLGWHFAYMALPELIEEKLRSSAHTELDLEEHHANIEASLRDGTDIFGRGQHSMSVAPMDSLPLCVQAGHFGHMVTRRVPK